MTSVTPSPSSLNRRAALRLISGTTLALLGTRFTFADAGGAAISPAPSLLTPEATEGPFYIGSERIRRDITEGKPGVPLRLRIQVLQLNTAAPVSHAAVDIWHCDAQGVYSGFTAHLGPPYGGKFPGGKDGPPGPPPSFAGGPPGNFRHPEVQAVPATFTSPTIRRPSCAVSR
jgi:hypothetical protein